LNRESVEEELGDLLFTVVNLSRFLGLDPEVTLKKSNRKFKQRFMAMEVEATSAKVDLSKLSKEELEELWQSAKLKSRPHVSSERKVGDPQKQKLTQVSPNASLQFLTESSSDTAVV
jgi:hypothetical protein